MVGWWTYVDIGQDKWVTTLKDSEIPGAPLVWEQLEQLGADRWQQPTFALLREAGEALKSFPSCPALWPSCSFVAWSPFQGSPLPSLTSRLVCFLPSPRV